MRKPLILFLAIGLVLGIILELNAVVRWDGRGFLETGTAAIKRNDKVPRHFLGFFKDIF